MNTNRQTIAQAIGGIGLLWEDGGEPVLYGSVRYVVESFGRLASGMKKYVDLKQSKRSCMATPKADF